MTPANIRTNFSDKRIDGYSLKKYTWKLLYIHMLGYEVNIGHMEVLKLVGSQRYSEKLCGYLSMQILWNENTELLKLLVQTVKKDLNPLVDNGTPQNEYIQCLALNFLANMGGRDFAEALATDVQKLLTNGNSRSFVR
jgi:AP-2 complex subunit alpha